MTTFWHAGVSFSAHLPHTASPVSVFSSAATARARPEKRKVTASSGKILRIVGLLEWERCVRTPPSAVVRQRHEARAVRALLKQSGGGRTTFFRPVFADFAAP